MSEKRELSEEAKNVLLFLVEGCAYVPDEDGYGGQLMIRRGECSSTVFNELARAGFVGFVPSGNVARLTDKGKLAYLRSTDELGDGKIYVED